MDVASYYLEIRNALFLSSMTLGTFIFTMKSFIVQVMKKEVYDKPEYQKKILDIQETGKNISCYRPLRNMSRLLMETIALSFFSALLHISLGMMGEEWATRLCLGITLVSWFAVAASVGVVSNNLRKMIDISENEFENKENHD